MNKTLAEFVMCFSLLYLIEGIHNSVKKKTSTAYKVSHILYPLFMVGVMIYFLMSGIIVD